MPDATSLTAADLLPVIAAQTYAAAHSTTPDMLDPGADTEAVEAVQAAIAGYTSAHLHQVLARVVALDSDPAVPHEDVAPRLVSFLVERIEQVTGERPVLPWEPPGVAAAITRGTP